MYLSSNIYSRVMWQLCGVLLSSVGWAGGVVFMHFNECALDWEYRTQFHVQQRHSVFFDDPCHTCYGGSTIKSVLTYFN